ncbi:SDR family oxidoreductase [Telluria mixta]|uniref:NADP-dependent 3-hydroxy acid dehydrogenase YdfG n=1 Tax=Telluria mixta TaxID=34071 RepID=A0ABT2C667_9BURK|nr:SDR family oxidoreductase [Telluria mixta]MCS0632888.1 SDR family oxidoreductase [Telluria mixta]WEM97959.1 SDR family oxidoreductase [Telluria mixta]
MSNANLGTAVVTGASTGIGALYADRLARRGYDLVLVARNGERLQAQADRLSTAYGITVHTIVADLTRDADLRRVEEVLRNDDAITLLVNNAGVGGTGPLLGSDVDKMQDMIALNVTALTRLTYAAAPGFVARGQGAFINIASIVAIAPEVLNGVYGGSKAYVVAFSQSLQHELADKGVRVQVVLPGATATDFWQIAGTPVEHLPSEIVMRAEDLVDAALAGYDQGEFATIPALEDGAKWNAYEAARRAMHPELSRTKPASRYAVAA